MSVIREDLDHVREMWNTHRIRPSRGAACPPGIPDELYFVPSPPAVECMLPVSTVLPLQIQQELLPALDCEDSSFGEYLLYICNFHNWTAPQSADEATTLYYKLLPFI